ncbi:MAG: DNA primase [Oscillospiraceae bacterium]|nr:DNA primase [Oscillospiraceae bacterium]
MFLIFSLENPPLNFSIIFNTTAYAHSAMMKNNDFDYFIREIEPLTHPFSSYINHIGKKLENFSKMIKKINISWLFHLQGLGISASEFINVFYSPDDTKIYLRVLADKKGSAFSGTNINTTLKELLEQHNSDNRGIFLVINAGGHTDREIIRINAQFVEMDNVSLEEQLAKIKAFPLEPSLIVKTRKSLHCYWLMKKAAVGEFRHIQKQLVKHFDGDSACVNESRVMRIPSFYHCKEEPILVECIKYNPEIRYTQEQLSEHLPDVPREADSANDTPISPSAGTQKGMIRVRCDCCFLQHCKWNAKTLPEPLWYAKITNLAVFEGGDDAIHLFSKPHPNYSFEQTQNKINRFRKSGTKPMTCAKIASLGFECLNLGKCKVKSPAGLAFIPMDMKVVRKLLTDCKNATTAYDNIEIARKFINDYLYNNELAESFINSEIKAKFAFKATEIKQLVSYHNDLYKSFSATANKKRDSHGNELPPWYEYKKNGTLKFMGAVLADVLVTEEKVIFCGDRFHFYEDGVYAPKEDLEAENFVRTFMSADNDKTYSQISDTTKQWKMQIYTNSSNVNANAYLINLKNGIYNIHTRQLSPHNPDILSTIRINANYDPEAKCHAFLKYLADVLPESEHCLIQEMLGYVLVPINKAKKAIIFSGEKDTGKSTILFVFEDVLLGEDNVSNVPLQKLDDRFSTIHLFGKLANIGGDFIWIAIFVKALVEVNSDDAACEHIVDAVKSVHDRSRNCCLQVAPRCRVSD